jgi:hypothetical protein
VAAAFLGGWPPICGGSLVWSSWSYVFLEVVVSFLVFLGVLWWFFLLLVGFSLRLSSVPGACCVAVAGAVGVAVAGVVGLVGARPF